MPLLLTTLKVGSADGHAMMRSFMNTQRLIQCLNKLSLLVLAQYALASQLQADEFVLKDGRKLAGHVRSENVIEGTKEKQFEKQFVVEIGPGVMVLVNQTEIKQHVRQSKAERAYAAASIGEAADTVEYHLKQASWCSKNGMTEHEVAHFERVLDLEPENKVARAGLNLVKSKDGRWIKRDELMREGRGKVLIGGKYRFPEVVAMEEAQEKVNLERIGLANDIRKWQHEVLTNPRRSGDSMAKLKALAGPMASAAVADVLFPKNNSSLRKEAPPDVIREVLVQVLEGLADSAAVQALIRLSLRDPSNEIRQQSLDALSKVAPKAAAYAFIAALNSDNPDEINAAARALTQIDDEAAILPLIDHLVTNHKRQAPGSNATNVAFGNEGSYTMGTEKPKVLTVASQNPDVLGALNGITGQNFNYDKAAWLSWYEQEYCTSSGDLRRDP